ncbi:hypothetical protein MM236_00475 [Belliella sp. DSM 107340]|uniref:Uncharacterized protein n=1 Tax=Belliella calami TaxID=2923436 RepID=A0ABS9UIJ9_9BACT|nr:hypothetical protein [Belliella calami]MCH7396434.1 hypothetical protein [Belliella calami]
MENNVKEYKILKSVIGSNDFSEIHKGSSEDNVNELAFHVGSNELYILMPYSNELGVLDLDNLKYKIEEFKKSKNRKYTKPKEFMGSGFEYSKLSKSERAEYKSDKHAHIYVDKDTKNIVSYLVSNESNKPYLIQSIQKNNNDYFEFRTEYPVSFDDQGHIIGYMIEEDYYEFFIKPFVKSMEE